MRVVMHELRDQVTVLLPDNSAARNNLTGLYALAAQLRPSLVVLDDIDLIIGSGRSSTTLVDFLASVDGAVNSHEGIITLAATNRLQVIDEAARRSARFDRLIELPRPPAAGRARILTRYLGRFADNVDVQRIATASAGATALTSARSSATRSSPPTEHPTRPRSSLQSPTPTSPTRQPDTGTTCERAPEPTSRRDVAVV
ncbi:AAA family ATPase [Egicoccus halophilus]|uniref:ATPase AAA-type core domain-containing protein n=1 Tax=Egicoccus halophilus TaxID=1670830 RepID=A0A8J3A5G6_9ACTN|nr:AAA family ATPase [Egicoccus halophilus]GGI03544.1 hypothetical protein GCM10011354_04560 [Egicoccus halophilus]